VPIFPVSIKPEEVEEMNEPKATVLPIYFIADESLSMKPVIGEMNKGLRSLLDTLHTESFAAAKVRLAILGFSDTTKCHLELSDLRGVTKMPELGAYNSTSYESAFRELRRRIPEGVATLKREGYLVNRPAVFFLTDGVPNTNEPWRNALAELKRPEFREHPNILAFGIGDEVDPKVIREVASREDYALVTAKGSDVGEAVANFIVALTQSIISSGQALADGKAELQMEKPEGFKLAVDIL
jgi:uncharacterized protein YegL